MNRSHGNKWGHRTDGNAWAACMDLMGHIHHFYIIKKNMQNNYDNFFLNHAASSTKGLRKTGRNIIFIEWG